MNCAPQSLVAGMRVLVVEDEMMVAMALEYLLQAMDCDVVKVGRLDKAIRLAQTETVNGALLDVNLAGGSGYPVADELDRRDIPFIFMTGYDASRLEGEYNGHAALQKPFQEEELERMMAAMFRPVG